MTSATTGNRSPRLLVATDDSVNGGAAHLARQLALALSSHFELGFAGNLPNHRATALHRMQIQGVTLHDYAVSHDNPTQQAHGTIAAHKLVSSAMPDLILCVDANVVSLLALKDEAARQGIPFLVVVNSLPTTMHTPFALHLAQSDTAFNRATAVIFVCEAHRNKWRSLFPNVSTRQFLIRNFCDELFFAPRSDSVRRSLREELGIKPGDFLCLTAARLGPEKGQLTALRALKRMIDKGNARQARFVFAGSATNLDLNRFHEEVARLNLGDRVSYLGTRDDVADLMDASDCFVLASSNEGASLSVIEAMAKGLPIITTDVGDMSETVTPLCGKIIPSPASDEEACIAALANALDEIQQDHERLERYGIQSRARAQAVFRSDRATAEYVARLLDTSAQQGGTGADGTIPKPFIIDAAHPIDFGNPAVAWNTLLDGWSDSEPRGVWSIGPRSRMLLRLRAHEPRIVLRFLVKPFLDTGWTSQTTEVQMGGRTVGLWYATRSKSQTFDLEIDLAPNETDIELTFLNRTPASPYELGLNEDERFLSFLFRAMFVLPAERSLSNMIQYATARAGLALRST